MAEAAEVAGVGEVRRLTPEMRREQTRAYLLDAAAAVFAAKGYHAASLDEIADSAGFTKGAIYSNFDGKEGLFLALVEQRQRAMIVEFFAALDPSTHADPAERLRDLTRVSGRLVPTGDEWALWQEFQLFAFRNPALGERLREEGRAQIAAVAALLEERCRAAGVALPLPPEDLARLCIGVIAGVAAERALDPDAVSDADVARLLAFVSDVVTGAPGAPGVADARPRTRSVRTAGPKRSPR